MLLTLAAWLIAAPVLAATGYLFFLTLRSKVRPPPLPVPPKRRFDIIVPSHNEEAGIADTVRGLLALDYPPELFRAVVIADNCSDETAARAQEAGALVWVRHHAELRGKGYALQHAFERALQEGFADAFVVIDADTQVSPNLLRAFSARLEAGARACQAHYGVLNPTASWRTRLMTIALALFHRLRSLGRENWGVSCGLRGNGMCFTTSLLREVPHEAFSIVEDVEYGIRLGQRGIRVHFCNEADVKGEMVSGEKASRSQRRRWEGGRVALARQHGAPLLRQALAQRSALLFDLAMDVLVPPLSWLGLAAMLGTLAAAGACFWTGSAAPLVPWLLAGFFLTAYVLRGWQLSKVGARGLLDLAYAPIYLTWKLTLLLKRSEHKKGEWVRTAREGEPP